MGESFKQSLLSVIRGIESKKKADKVAPTYALIEDVHREVNNALNDLYNDGSIEVGVTLNSKYIKIVQ